VKAKKERDEARRKSRTIIENGPRKIEAGYNIKLPKKN
jgi:hypothetical protein